jgi:hypothetical protein
MIVAGTAELYRRGGRISHCDWEETMTQLSAISYQSSANTLRLPRGNDDDSTLNHFSAAFVFALFASIVFGITHRETSRDMVRYGLYCFAMFLGGTIAGRLGHVAVA